MANSSSRLLQLILSLSPKEVKQFTLYLSSPYFNTNERISILWKYLSSQLDSKKPLKTDNETIFNLLYKKTDKIKKQQVYDHFSFLLRHLENFLALQNFEQSEAAKNQHLLASLKPRNQEFHFERIYRKAAKKWDNHTYLDTNYYFDRFQQTKEGAEFFAQKQRRTNDDFLTETISYLDIGYLSSRLKYACEAINRGNILQEEASEEESDWISNLIASLPKTYRNIPVIQIYLQIYFTLKYPQNEANYQHLVSLLKEHTNLFPKEEINDMYTYAQNYCIKMINGGKSAYHSYLFDLFQDLLDKDLLIEKGIIDHRKYKNVVTVGLRMNAYEWVINFINRYRDHLPEAFRENAFNYNLAAFYYEQKQYSQALQLLNQVSFSDVYYHLSSRAMILKIYFEMEEENALDSLLDTFRIYLDRNKTISTYQRTVHKNLIKFTRKLSRLRNKAGVLSHSELTQKLDQLENQIRETQQIANINWLTGELLKVRELVYS